MRIFWHVIRADFFSHWEQKGPGQGQPLRWKKKTVLDLPATFSLPCQASSLTHTSLSSLLLQNAASRLFSPSSLALQVCFELTDDPPLCDSSTSLLSPLCLFSTFNFFLFYIGRGIDLFLGLLAAKEKLQRSDIWFTHSYHWQKHFFQIDALLEPLITNHFY